MAADPLRAFSPPVADWFRRSFERPTPAQSKGWPPIAAGKHTLVLAPTGSGKDARRLPDRHRRPRPRPVGARHARALRQPAEGPEPRRRAKPARAAPRHRDAARGGGRRAKRRHAPARAGRDAPPSARHPDHHARVALSDPHLGRARDAGRRPDGHRRRDPCPGGGQARDAPRALARAARAPDRRRPAADRALGHPAAARRDRPVPGRRPARRDRRRRPPQAARSRGGRAGARHARAGWRAGARR